MITRGEFHYSIDENTELEVLTEQHIEALFALTDENRDHLKRWLPWVDSVQTISDAKRYIRSSIEQLAEENGFQAGIWYQGQLAGVIGYHHVDWINRSTTIGYWLGAHYQGKGLVSQACWVLVDWAFREWRLNRVEIRCASENYRSRAVPKRLGFTEEGIIREAEWLYDHFVDLVVYGMTARDWRKINSQRHTVF